MGREGAPPLGPGPSPGPSPGPWWSPSLGSGGAPFRDPVGACTNVYSTCHNKRPPLGPGGGDGQALSNKVGGGMEELVPVVWARGGMGMRCPVVLDVKPWFGTFISEFI